MQDQIRGLHIEPTNICTLQCPGCARTQFRAKWLKHWTNQSLVTEDLDDFLDIDLANIRVHLCGNYGDPIYHQDLHGMVAMLKQRGATVIITTNGSYRAVDWWQHLIDLLDSTDTVIFSVDGMPDNFTKYRVNADWPSISAAIGVVTASTVNTVWKCIPFKFNQHQIDQIRSFALGLGCDQFLLDPSERFDEHTLQFMPSAVYQGPKLPLQQQVKSGSTVEVTPKCHSGIDHYVSAWGFYSPCCYVADQRFYYKTPYGQDSTQFDIRSSKLSAVLAQQQHQKFVQQLLIDPPKVCQYNCASTHSESAFSLLAKTWG